MKITRRFTQAGTDVFDSVAWARRSSRITNPDGSVVFEMTDAEVPASWSQLATDIMVSKYFRKAGVPQVTEDGKVVTDDQGRPVTGPERSARQVIHRLAGCWRHWGEQYGYFDTAEDAQAFYDELCYMLLTQMAAPNSPQWFNTGLAFAYGMTGPAQGHWYVDPETGECKLAPDAYTHPQPHACFIQSIEDDLANPGGIMDLWTREARLFKYGSGTGTNFSNIRAENEPLSGGGKSSGLMSFLKIGDRAAGAIKSGGTTRRAAKMVCLDIDHPDVESFVNWKVREELKVAAMAEGLKHLPARQRETAERLGLELDFDFNGEAYQTVSGQNSNNSVRISNAFFRAVDDDAYWDLHWRTSEQIARSIRARDLWDQIGFAAWRCADPGVQYDTTINQWHTCPASGRINASNPCVTGDTLVATTTGYRRIADLVDQTVEVVNGDGQAVVVDRVFKTGHKDIFELKTRSGYSVRLTADHKVKTANRGDVPAIELTVDDVLMLERPGFGDAFVPEPFGELLGMAVGDGCVSHQPNQDFLFVTLGEGERDLAERMRDHVDHCKQWLGAPDQRGQRSTRVTQTAGGLRVGTSVQAVVDRLKDYAVLDEKSSAKQLRDAVFSLDRRSQAALLRGLFTADGTVANDGGKSQYIALDSTSLTMLRQVQLLLLGFGVKAKLYENRRALSATQSHLPDGRGGSRPYPVQQMHTLRISRASRVIFEREIGFIEGTTKARRLAEMNRGVVAYAERFTDRVHSLSPCGHEDVYDLTEPVSHHFVANGMVVHNCSEYMFLDNTACNLASINLLTLYDAESRSFDIEGFEHAIELWTIVLEISVLMAAFPSKEIARLSYEFRTLGLGFANLGAMLMQAGIAYDSDRGRAIAGALGAVMTGRSYAASAKIAGEHGPFPGFYKNREHMLRVIRNHRRAAYGVCRDRDECGDHDMGWYESLEIPPVPIESTQLESDGGDYAQLADSDELLRAARRAWDDALKLGEAHGYRNAQVSVIAPTGTIGLLMDCDTTGVEPDFSLVKFKKLAGGGYFKIANQSIRPALASLGYTPEQVDGIMTYVMGTANLDVPLPDDNGAVPTNPSDTFKGYLQARGATAEDLERLTAALGGAMDLSFVFNAHTLGQDAMGRLGLADAADPLAALDLTAEQVATLNEMICGRGTIEGAPHLRDEHLPVFDCANRCGRTGERFIAPQGHIRMMAAVQPFISGAISKTINLPNEAEVDDIKAAYRLSWELGLKANALYRDGSKLSQVLQSTSDEKVAEEAEDEEAVELAKKEVSAEVVEAARQIVGAGTETQVEKVVERIVERPLRRRLPNTRQSITHKFNVAGHEGYLTVGLYEDGTPGELFITMAKEGSTIGGLMDSLGTAISVALQYGVPTESLVKKFTHQRFEPAGMTDNREIPFAKSLVDYIFRWMGMEFIEGYREANAPNRGGGEGASRPVVKPKARVQATAERPGGKREAPAADAPRSADDAEDAGDADDTGSTHAGRVSRLRALNEDADESDQANGGNGGHRGNGSNPAGGQAVATDVATRSRLSASPAPAANPMEKANSQMMGDAPACDVCGSITVRNGTCYKCLNCGNSMGCS